MSEKEFLERFLGYSIDCGYGSAYDLTEIIGDFLEEFHNEEYIPVSWRKIGEILEGEI